MLSLVFAISVLAFATFIVSPIHIDVANAYIEARIEHRGVFDVLARMSQFLLSIIYALYLSAGYCVLTNLVLNL